MNINKISSSTSKVAELTAQLTVSLRRPSKKTMTLLDKALSYLTPFESARASVTSPAERRDLLELLTTHRLILSPYLDTTSIESNLKRPSTKSTPC